MCPPKTPKVEKIPDRQASRMPDQGDPSVRMADRSKRRLSPVAAMVMMRTGGKFPMPSVSGPLGVSGKMAYKAGQF